MAGIQLPWTIGCPFDFPQFTEPDAKTWALFVKQTTKLDFCPFSSRYPAGAKADSSMAWNGRRRFEKAWR